MLCSLRPTAAALLVGRIFLGVGESFTATGATLWGIKTVGAIHTSRVISWNGVATYVCPWRSAPPLGVMLNGYFGISGFAAVVILAAAVVALAFILILRIYLQQPLLYREPEEASSNDNRRKYG